MEAIKRYIPLAVWIVVALTLIVLPAKILGYGYLPADDALRHAAKVVSGKPWSEILVMRSGFEIDPHQGWHAVLGVIYRNLHCTTEQLVLVPMFGLMLLVSIGVLPGLRRPEAWLTTLLIAEACGTIFIKRTIMGRPYVFTLAVLMVLLSLWCRIQNRNPRTLELLLSTVLIAAAAWIHGSFYQLALPAAAILLAGRWRQAVWYSACWAAGSFLGACLTGHPVQFLEQCLRHLFTVFGTYSLARQLVSELTPSDGDIVLVLAVLLLILWRSRSPDWKPGDLLHPAFMLGVLGWMLGLEVSRFWLDWGLPALLFWMALELQKQFEMYSPVESCTRLVISCGVAMALFFAATADRAGRWTWNLTNQYLQQSDPELAGWLPEKRGVLYSADMRVFFDTFYKNPTAPWRYILGFESALMPPEDLAVVRKVRWNFGAYAAYDPWLAKMRPGDRLVIRSLSSSAPNIPKLEWHLGAEDLWIGRLPRETNSSPPLPSHDPLPHPASSPLKVNP